MTAGPPERSSRIRWLTPAAAALTTGILALGASPALAASFTASPSVPDGSTTSCTPGPCSLREAISEADASTDATDTIFLDTGTYDLTQGELQPDPSNNVSLTLIGQGSHASDTVINAQGGSRVMTVGPSASTGTVTIAKVEITGGNGTGSINNGVGGAIYVYPGASLTLAQDSVTGNTAATSGGGIDTNGALTVIETTISNNSVTGGGSIGGGIDNFAENGAAVTVTNSTITGNSAVNQGGAINNGSTLRVLNSTIAGNSTANTVGGGGLAGGAQTVDGTILAQNASGDCQTPNTYQSIGYNIADDSTCGLTGPGDMQNTNPLLVQSGGAPLLADNGGPTETIALQSGSPAIDAQTQFCPSTDQRNFGRPDPGDTGSPTPCDIGAYESGAATTYQLTVALGGSGSGTVTGNGISCPGTCAGSYPAGTAITLTATPASGSTFTGWGGDCTGTGQCSLTMSADHAVTASFSTATTTTTTTTTTTATTTTTTTTAPPPPPLPPPPSSDLALAVSHVDPFTAGQGGPYHVVVANRGAAWPSGPVTVSATLPSGITYSSESGSDWSCSPSSGGESVACQYHGAALASNGSTSFDINVAASGTATAGVASFTLNDSGDSDTSDKSVSDRTTVVGAGAVKTFLSGPTALLAGATTPLQMSVSNQTRSGLPAGVSAQIKVPSGTLAGFKLSASASGQGWVCSTLPSLGADVVNCAYGQAIGAGQSAPTLTIALTAGTGVSSSTPVQLTYLVKSAAGAVLAGPIVHQLGVRAATTSRAQLALRLQGSTSLVKTAQPYTVLLGNTGAGPTTAGSAVHLVLPADVHAGTPSGAGWSCQVSGQAITCGYAKTLAPGGQATTLKLPLAGTPGGASPARISASASSSDAVGQLQTSTQLDVDQPPAGTPHPVVQFLPLSGHTGAAGTSHYSVVVSNKGDAATSGGPLQFTQTLPAGVTATGTGPGWSCSQHSTALACTYSSKGLTPGGKTGALSLTVAGASSFTGSSVPVHTSVTTGGIGGHSYTTTDTSYVGVAAVKQLGVVPQATVDEAAAPPGATVNVTFGLTNQGGSDAAGPLFVALALPDDLTLASTSLPKPTPDQPIPAPGSSTPAAAPPVGAGPGMSCLPAGPHAVVCEAQAVSALSATTITVPVTLGQNAAGTETMQAGLINVPSSVTPALQLITAQGLVEGGGQSVLTDSTPVSVRALAFEPEVGPDQQLPVASEAADGTITSTTVKLDASKTVDAGKPLSFAWVQTSGPAVKWAPSVTGTVPGGSSSLPSFPTKAFTSYQPPLFGPGGKVLSPGGTTTTNPQVYGPQPSFTFEDPRSLSGPTVFTFEVFVTDGSQFRTATTTVKLDPLPPAPPVPPQTCLWDLTRNPVVTQTTCLPAGGRTPGGNDLIVAGPITPYTHDSSGHVLRYQWAFTQPSTAPPAIGAQRSRHAICGASDYRCFPWPNGAPVVTLTATITNGHMGAQGQPEQAVATATAGSAPAAPAITISGVSGPVVAGSKVQLTASVPGGASYDWSQTGGPTVAGVPTTGATLSFTAPAPTTGQTTATFEVKATQAVGAALSSGTRDITVTLVPAPPLGATVNAAAALSVALGKTLALQATGSGGSGSGYKFKWSVGGGGGSVSTTNADGSDATYTPGSGAGVASLQLTITDSSGANTSITLPVTVGSVPSFGSSSSASCDSGPLASIFSQLAQSKDATLKLGPFALDLGQPSGSSCQDILNGATLNFTAGNINAGPFTISGVAGKLSSSGITLSSGTVTAPSNWNLGQGSISTAIDVPFDGSPSGALTWTGKLPFLAAPGTSSNATTTISYANGTATLKATVPLAGGTATLNATVPSDGSTFSANVSVSGGKADGSTGSVQVDSDGSVTPNVTLNLSDLPTVAGVTISNANLHWDNSGLTLNANATIGGAVQLTLKGAYQDSSNWNATATFANGSSDPSWLPSGVSLSGATITGAVTDDAGAITFDVKLDSLNPWTFSSGGSQLFKVNNLTAEFSNATPPSGCSALTGLDGSVWLLLSGNAAVTLPKLPKATISASACVSPTTGDFVVTTSGLDGFTPFSGVPLTLDGLSLTLSYVNSNLSISAAGQLTVDGVTAAGTLTLLPDGSIAAVGAIPDLSKLGLPLPGGTAGAVFFSTEDIPDLGSAPTSLFAGTHLTQSSYNGVSVQADSVTVTAAFDLPSSLQCLLDQTIYKNPCSSSGTAPSSGNAAPGSAVISADIGAGIPTITATLSAGTNGLTLFSVGNQPSAVSLTLDSIDLQMSLDGTVSVGGSASLMLPTPGATTPSESTLQLSADVSIDPTGPTISMAATISPSCRGANAPGGSGHLSALCNLLGVQGLDLSALSVQLGINFATTPIPTPTFGFAAGITGLPCSWAAPIHYHEGGCQTDSSGNLTGAGNPNPNSPQAEPISIAVNIADTGPIFAFQLGQANNHPVFSFGNALSVDDASLVVAPVGGTIGAGPNAVTFQPGISVDFDAQVMNVPVSVHAAINPLALSVKANASVGQIGIDGLTIQQAMFNLAVDPTDGIKVGFSGGLTLPGGANLQAALSIQATAPNPSSSQQPGFTLSASGGNIKLGSAELNNFNLSATGTLADGVLPQLNLEGTANGTLLGQQLALAGGVDITPGVGITGANLWADPGNFSLGGVSLSGQGCGPAAPKSLPSTGPCIGASFDPTNTSNPLSVTLDATASFNGLGVSFDGTLDNTGIDIPCASVTFVDPLDSGGRPISETMGSTNLANCSGNIGQLSGRLYLGSDSALAGLQATDPQTGQTVQVHNGDFDVQGQSNISLAGFNLSGNFAFGSLQDAGVFAHGGLNIDTLGSSLAVSGSFNADSSGNIGYDLVGDGNAVSFDGYSLASVHAELSDSHGLFLRGSLNLGAVSGTLSGKVNIDDRQGLLYSVSGSGSLNVLGAGVNGNFTVANEDSNGDGLGYVYANVNLNGGFNSQISFTGSATFDTNGNVCPISGSVSVANISGTAKYCSSTGAIGLDFNYLGYDLSGSYTPGNWDVVTSVAPDSFDLSGSAFGLSGEVKANWAFDFGVSSAGGLAFNLDGSATANGSVGPVGFGPISANLSGSLGDVCGGGKFIGTQFEVCADSKGVHFTKPGALAS